MKTKQPIKVIKRSERVSRAAEQLQQQPADELAKKTTQETARDMVATVSSWVNDFQQRRRNETTQALKTLFADTAVRPTGA
jgi:hypothetical protein